MHPIQKQTSSIVLFGIILALFGSIWIYKPSYFGIHDLVIRDNPLPNPSDTPTPTPADFCLDVPVLFYHHIQPFATAEEKNQSSLTVSPENFAWHMSYLVENGYTIITLKTLIESIRNHAQVPEKSIVITLDDGYRDSYTYAYPIVKKYNTPISIAIITGMTGHPEHLTRSMIKEMSDSGYIEIVSHSLYHASLAAYSDETVLSALSAAEEDIKDMTGTSSGIVIYPYGKHSQNTINLLDREGFAAAFDVEAGTKQCESNIYSLPRLRIGNAGPKYYGL